MEDRARMLSSSYSNLPQSESFHFNLLSPKNDRRRDTYIGNMDRSMPDLTTTRKKKATSVGAALQTGYGDCGLQRAVTGCNDTISVFNEPQVDSPTAIGDYLIDGSFLGGNKQQRGIHIKTGKFATIKEVSVEGIREEEVNKIVETIKKLNHRNIVRYYDTYTRGQHFFLFYEFIQSGSLRDIIDRFGPFPESLVIKYVKQILSAIEYLHNKDIVHRDIKASNILVTKDGRCKLTEICLFINPTLPTSCYGTPRWMAPEVLADLNDYVHKSADIWSLGAMIVELITGFPPFHEVSPIKVCFGILEGSVDPIEDHIPGISKLLFSFLNCCFQIPPDSRPSVTELLAHPWLNQSSPSATPHLSSFIPHLPSHSHSTHSYSEEGGSGVYSGDSFTEIENQDNLVILRKELEKTIRESQVALEGKESSKDNSQIEEKKEEAEEEEEGGRGSEKQEIDLAEKAKKLISINESLFAMLGELHRDLVSVQSNSNFLSTKFNQSTEKIEKIKRNNEFLHDKINSIERNLFVSDFNLTKIIYGNDLPFDKFSDAKRGVLKVAKKVTKRFKKKFVVMKDNFLFFYKPGNLKAPGDVVWLVDVKLTVFRIPVYTFQLLTRNRNYILSAAKEDIMMDWMSEITAAVPWYKSTTNYDEIMASSKEPTSQLSFAKRRLKRISLQ